MPRRSALMTVAIVLSLVAAPRVIPAQAPGIQYAYDELGRLVAVVDQQSNVALYRYDAVGNLLAIERIDGAALPGPVAIAALVPEKGKAGTVVSILGKGFGAGADQNVVAFNGVGAPVTQASATRLVTTVPAAATTGPVTVTTPSGSAVSPKPFRVIGALVIEPASATLGVAGIQPFVARIGGAETTAVRWAVDGVVGGNAELGTISPQGRYVAPSAIAAPRTASVTATSNDDASVTATAAVTLRVPIAVSLSVAGVGVQADPGPRTLVASGVGVQRAPDGTGLTLVAPAVGLTPPIGAVAVGAAPVTAALAPLVTSISPAGVARGSANVLVALTGTGLDGFTNLEFLLNNLVDAAITVANPSAAADGTRFTAQISIGAGAAPGPRVARLRGPAGTTTSIGALGNVFTVQ
jgi:YD repeat-containing protein